MSPQYSRSPRTILVVDDDSSVVEVLHKILSRHGYEVLQASSAEQAAAAVREHAREHARGNANPIDLLIVDAVMPSVSGPELADGLLKLLPEMKVLFITGLDGLAIQLAFGRPCECIQKPFTVRFLVAKVEEMLGHVVAAGDASPQAL